MPFSAFLAPTLGGVLIGLAVAGLLLFTGKLAGISGVVGGLAQAEKGDRAWRLLFIFGMVGGGALLLCVHPEAFGSTTGRTAGTLAVAGLLVGVGTRASGGCTSGHGVCGLSLLSPRSLVATLTFIATGAATVAAVRLLGSAS
ncbi:MAG: YeeE/YedE family protein [Myxococcales bacterium]|nr:YeeE/YedE family protein [Myxococcales bacterium]